MSMHQSLAPAILCSMLVSLNGVTSIPVRADELSIQRGKAFARANCARCHSIDRSLRSPHRNAPAFRTLHTRYPVETLEDALAEGLSTGHPRMPEFRLEPGEIGDFINFLKSLE
jgi:cytochrome c